MTPRFSSFAWRRLWLRLLAVLVLLALQPWLWQGVKEATTRVHQLRSERQQLASVQERVGQIKQVMATQRELLDQLQVVVPTSEKLSQVVERLERVAGEQQAELTILDISTVPPPLDAAVSVPIVSVRVTLQVKGDATALLSFIDHLEHIQEIAVIEQWSLNPASVQAVPSPQPGQYLYSLTANVIFFLQDFSHATN